jgi:hypothetical protein
MVDDANLRGEIFEGSNIAGLVKGKYRVPPEGGAFQARSRRSAPITLPPALLMLAKRVRQSRALFISGIVSLL